MERPSIGWKKLVMINTRKLIELTHKLNVICHVASTMTEESSEKFEALASSYFHIAGLVLGSF